jgi:type II secretory pathway pseudopilin PulG
MTRRDRMVVVIVACLALVAGSWMLVIQPKRSQASKLGGQLTAEQSALDSARAQVQAGEAAKRSFPSDYATIARLGEAVPLDDNVPSLVYQLQHAASATGVDFRALQLQGGSGATSTAGAAAAASSATLPPGATVGAAGFPTLPFSFTFEGNFFHLADFFARLQNFVVATNQNLSVSGRLLTLNAISLGPSPTGGFPRIRATLSASAFLIPSSETLTSGATPAGPASAPAQTSTSGSAIPTPTAAAVPQTR